MNYKKIVLSFCIFAVFCGVFLLKPSNAKAITAEELRAQMDALLKQIEQLRAQLTEIEGKKPWCHNFVTNLGYGKRGAQIEALQIVLEKEGFTIPESEKEDKYFGDFTASAVVGFQEKYASEILAPWGLEHGTGYVGPTTRAKLNALYGCKTKPDITVISPNGGETWTKGTTQTIKWQDNAPIPPLCPPPCVPPAPKYYDIKLLPYYPPCTGEVCPGLSIAPYTIAKSVYGSSYNWLVGKVLDTYGTGDTAPDGSYTIQICQTGSTTCDSSDSYFKIVVSTPSITVISPNGGEQWVRGNTHNITWASQGLDKDAYLNIYLVDNSYEAVACTTNGMCCNTCTNWLTIATQIPVSSEKYSWTVPLAQKAGNHYKIMLRTKSKDCFTGCSIDNSDNYFSIVEKPSITVLSPNGGETWQLKSTHTILWTPYSYDMMDQINSASDVTAYLEKMVNNNFVAVGKVIPAGKASIHWDGEIDKPGNYAEAGDYYIRVLNNKTGAWDRSDNSFKLVPYGTIKADLKVNGSNGPITIPEGGATYPVSWASNAETCDIHYYTANLLTTEDLRGLPSSGERMMKFVPNTSPYDNYISLWCVAKSPIEGSASDQITIPASSAVIVFHPNGGEIINRQTSYTIQWDYSKIDKISIALYKDDKFFKWIVSDYPLSVDQRLGTYTWMPSATISSGEIGNNVFKIYIIGYKPGGGTVEDKSDAPFSIVEKPVTVTCTDSDGGIEYYTKGIVYTEGPTTLGGLTTGTYNDLCWNNGPVLHEWYCGTDKTAYKKEYTCPNGCKDGACVPQTSSITVLSPNGGEEWVIGQTKRVSWSATGVNYVRIYIEDVSGTISGSGSTNYIYDGVISASTGYYDWTIQKNQLPGLTFPRNYKIRVDGVNDAALGSTVIVRDKSDNYFSIVEKKVGSLIISIAPDTPLSQNIVKGSTNVTFLRAKFTADSIEDIRVNTISVYPYIPPFKAVDLASSNDVINFKLYDGSTQIGTTQQIHEYKYVTFTNLNWIIPKSSSKILTVKADVSTTTTVTSLKFAIYCGVTTFATGMSSGVSISSLGNAIGNEMTIISEVACTDSDGGMDYYTFGDVRLSNLDQDHQDFCRKGTMAVNSCSGSECYVLESYCLNNDIRWDQYVCSYGCQDGACKLGVKLSPENPLSHEMRAGATTQPLAASSEISHLFLAFEIDNPSKKTVSIEELAVLLEGTAKISDFGQVVWTDAGGNGIGTTYFAKKDPTTAGYAKIPDPFGWVKGTPLLTIPPKSKQTIKVFAYINAGATEGATARFSMSSQDYFIKATGFNFGGFPIQGNTMTITKKTIPVQMQNQGTYEMPFSPGTYITGTVNLTNNSSEDAVLTEIAIGNPQASNDFLKYTDNTSYSVHYLDKSGATKISQLRDTLRTTATGYRIFNIVPTIVLPANSTVVYWVQGKLNATIPVNSFQIILNEFSGYGVVTYSPVKSSGTITVKINLSTGGAGYLEISNYLAAISETISKIMEELQK